MFYKYMAFARFKEREEMSMKNDDNKIKDVKSTVNLISGAYTLPLIDKLFSNSQRIEDRRLETEEEKIPV